VLRGARIGDGAHILSGSTVFGVIAPGALVAGVPARTKGKESPQKTNLAVASIVKRMFGLSSLPTPLDGPGQIPEWTSAAFIRLLLALEEVFEVTLPAEQVLQAGSIADLSKLVARAREESGAFGA
jgi:acyl carrier protein